MKKLASALLLAFLLPAACESQASAQERAASPEKQPGGLTRISADETFDLEIPERRIVRSNYRASTSVELSGSEAPAVALAVGVAVSAGTINVLLRGVTGHVRFRATLEPVLTRIRLHRAAGAGRQAGFE